MEEQIARKKARRSFPPALAERLELGPGPCYSSYTKRADLFRESGANSLLFSL